jgi:hypothetical protein
MARKKSNLLEALFADIQKQAERRQKADTFYQKALALRRMLMPIQVTLEADPSRFIAVRAARRTGKSTGVMFIVTIRCLERAESEWVVIGLTRQSIKRIYWGPLQKLNEAFELGIKFQHQEMTATLPNGSKIYFVGADNLAEIEKLRGGKYDGVIVDESKSFPPLVFEELIQDVLSPALLDKNGQMFVIGTPGDMLEGPFYLATCEPPIVIELESGDKRQSNARYGATPEYPAQWSLHAWSLADNITRFADPRTGKTDTLWERALAHRAFMGWSESHPTWRREYLGFWVANDAKRVYRYHTWQHDYVPLADTRWGLPVDLADKQWLTCIGVDFGSKDGTAMVVWAFSPTEKGLWELYSEKRTSTDAKPLNVSAVAAWFKDLEAEYGPFQGYPADPAGLATMVMQTLADEHNVILEPAEKKEKLDHIELMNNDFDAGLIHIRKGSILSEELIKDRWLEKTLGTDKKKEDPSVPNDAVDAALYAFRWCLHRQARQLVSQPAMYSREWWERAARAELAALEQRARDRASDAVQLDRPWWTDDSN